MFYANTYLYSLQWFVVTDKNTTDIQNDEMLENHEFLRILKTHL